MRSVPRSMLVAAAALAVAAFPAFGQVELTPTVGYQFGGFLESNNFKYTLNDGLSFGGIVGVPVSSTGQVELVFSYQDTDVKRRDRITSAVTTLGSATVWGLQLGGLYDVPTFGQVQPFLSGGVGFTTFDPSGFSGDDPDTATKFSGNLAGGARLGTTGPVGLRLMGRLWLISVSAGSGFWCGTGGCVIAAGGDVIVRWELLGGLSFKLGGRR